MITKVNVNKKKTFIKKTQSFANSNVEFDEILY